MSIRLIDVLQAGMKDGSGSALAFGTVTAYDAGTTALRTVYQDYALSTAHANPLTLDTEGKAKAYTNKRVKLVVRSADGAVVTTIDNVGTIAADIIALVGNAATGVTVNVKDSPYNALGDGIADDAIAIQAAITAVSLLGGGTVSFPAGTYLIGTELLVPDYVMLQGVSRVGSRLLANANAMTLIHHKGSYGGARDLGLYGNGKTAVSGLRVTPLVESQTVTRVDQNYNHFENLYIRECTEGIVLKCGPDVGGADSGCWYNTFESIHIQYCTRGIWLANGPNASSSGCNRNKFIAIRIGQSTNTGVQIDCASTCAFYGVDFEGVDTGTSPQTTPTALYISQSGTYSGDNNSNKFFGCVAEGCTRALDNRNAYTELYGCDLSPASLTANPLFWLGGSAGSVDPMLSPAFLFQGNSQIAGYENNALHLLFGKLGFPATQLPSTDVHVLDDYEEGTFTPAFAADGGSGYTYTNQAGRYQKIGKRVFFDLRVTLSGYSAAGTTNAKITGLPFTAVNVSTYSGVCSTIYTGTSAIANSDQLMAAVIPNTSEVHLYDQGPNSEAAFSGANITTSLDLFISGNYEATA